MTRPSLVDDPADPFLPGQAGIRAVAPSEPPPSYQEVPEGQSPALRALADAVIQRIWGIRDPNDPTRWLQAPRSPWRRFVQASLLPEDVTKYQLGRAGAPTGVDPTISVAGPSAQIQAFDLRSDHQNVSPPADITWTGLASITPRETIALSTISNERLGEYFLVGGIDPDGDPLETRSRVDPSIVTELADALDRRANDQFINATATPPTDARTGVVSFAGITSQAAISQPYIDDAIIAVESLRILKRDPTAIFVPWALAKLWRLAKSTTGQYLFDPAEPLSIDGVPVVGHNGIASGASTFFLVGDWSRVKALWRLLPNGRLVSLAISADANFNNFTTTFRLIERWDQNLTPGYGPSIVKVTGVAAT
jgi:Phage capsid family